MRINNKTILIIGIILLLSTMTLSAVSAEQLNIKPTSEDKNINWEFTGTENPDYKAGYEFVLISRTDGQVYYLTKDDAKKMFEYEPKMKEIDQRANNFETSEDISYGVEFDNSNEMDMEYSTGNTIGAYNDARVITHIKINGKEVF